jgi:hypothetical protein
MDYKFSIFISHEGTFGFLIPVPLYEISKNIFFKIYLFKVTRAIKSNMLIMNIAILKLKNVFLKKRSIFPYLDLWTQTGFLTLLDV